VTQLHFFCPFVLPSIGAQWSLRYQQHETFETWSMFKPGFSILVVSFDKRQVYGSSAIRWARRQRCPWLILRVTTGCFRPCCVFDLSLFFWFDPWAIPPCHMVIFLWTKKIKKTCQSRANTL
jgi:hypothetical protein